MNKILKIKKVNVLKMGFIMAVVYGILSVVIFLIIGVFGLAIQGQSLGLLLMVFMPVIYAIVGFIGGIIMGALYNIVSKWLGGIEVEVEEIEKFSE